MTMDTHPDETIPIVHVPDCRDRSLAAVLGQFRNPPRMRQWIRAQGAAFQIMEDNLFDLHYGSLLEKAQGDALDQWGGYVGEQRGGLGDDDYRRFIEARILCNIFGNRTIAGTATSHTAELVEIFDIVTRPNSAVWVWNVFPMTFQLTTVRVGPLSDQMVRRVVQTMALVEPVGIDMVLVEALEGFEGFDSYAPAYPIDSGLLSRELV